MGLEEEEIVIEKTSQVEEKKIEFLDSNLKEQLSEVTKVFEKPIELVVIKNGDSKSQEMENAVREISSTSDKLKFSSYSLGENNELENKIKIERAPVIAILDNEGNFSGIKYATIPGGHELNSFILAMYNVAGPGQKLEEETLRKIFNLKEKLNIKIGISLNCTKCPETVQAAQRVAVENSNIDLEVIDVFTFKEFKEKYDIMSVPAMIINNENIYFGSKNINEVLEIISK